MPDIELERARENARKYYAESMHANDSTRLLIDGLCGYIERLETGLREIAKGDHSGDICRRIANDALGKWAAPLNKRREHND